MHTNISHGGAPAGLQVSDAAAPSSSAGTPGRQRTLAYVWERVGEFPVGVDDELKVAARGFLRGHKNPSTTKACTRWTSPKVVSGMQTTYADCNSHRWKRADGATERLCCVRWKFVRRDDDFGEACPAIGDVDVCLLFVD